MKALNLIYLALGRIRGLDVSFEIYVATCGTYTTFCHEVLISKALAGLRKKSESLIPSVRVDYLEYSCTGVLGFECRPTPDILVVVGLSHNRVNINRKQQINEIE